MKARLRALRLALRTTSVRLAAVQWAVTFLSVVLVLGMIVRATEDLLAGESRTVLATELRGFADIHTLGGLSALVGAIDRRVAERQWDANVYLLVAPDGSYLAGNLDAWPSGAPTAPVPVVQEGLLRIFRTDLGRPAQVNAVTVQLMDGARLLLGRDAEIEARSREALGLAVALGLIFATLAAAASGWVLSRMLLGRIGGITTTAQAIISGDLSQRVPAASGGDEFDRLAETLNRMIDRIEAQMAELRLVTDSLAHDLRSPLTRLRLHLNQAQAKAPGETMERALDEVAQIERLLKTMLDLARAEAGIGQDQMAPVDLGALAEDIAELFEPLAETREVTLAVEVTEPVVLSGHRDLLFLALSNLVENALRFAPVGSRVLISLANGEGPRLGVADSGPGIPAEARQRAVGRFVRLDCAEGPATGTAPRTGLGLALVAAIARLHDARLLLEDNAPGLRAVLSFPVTRAVADAHGRGGS